MHACDYGTVNRTYAGSKNIAFSPPQFTENPLDFFIGKHKPFAIQSDFRKEIMKRFLSALTYARKTANER